MRTLENFVDGAFQPALDGATEPVLNPASGEEIAQAPLSGAADIDAAVAAARRAFEGWSQTTPAERATALLGIADAIEDGLHAVVAAGGTAGADADAAKRQGNVIENGKHPGGLDLVEMGDVGHGLAAQVHEALRLA